MSTYGAASFLYKAQIPRTDAPNPAPDAVKYSMLPRSQKYTESENVHINLQGIEFGSDALVDLPKQDDSLLSDYSLCNLEGIDCSPKPGTSSPIGEASGYVFPKDYPKQLGLDTELRLTGTLEPYVVADFEKKGDIASFGNVSEGHSKDSIDLLSMDTPGRKQESAMRSIPSLYPSYSPETSNSFKSPRNSPGSSPTLKHRANPFKETNLSPSKRKLSTSVSYSDVISPNSSSESSRQLDKFVGGNVRHPMSDPGSSRGSRFVDYPRAAYPRLSPSKPVVMTLSQSGNEIDEVITAMKGTFNNAVQYIASLPGNSFDSNSSICFLGKLYNGKHFSDERESGTDSLDDQNGTFQDFVTDFRSRAWITYRRGFSPLGTTSLTSDTGWGCMLRTGQMMLATALQIHCFGRGWRRTQRMTDIVKFQELVRCFGETRDHPFSIQNLLKIGKDHLNKSYGEWYGPSTVAYVLRVCVDDARAQPKVNHVIDISDFIVFTATDCMVFKGDIQKTATLNFTRSTWTKTLLLISVRMGADELNLSYRKPIQTFLLSPLCIGIMGGRKRHSLYFTGFQGNKLIHYDPHTCQTALKMTPYNEFSTDSYICMKPRKMSFTKMDPSSTFAFYLRNEADLMELEQLSESMGNHKIFEMLDGTKEEYLSLVYDSCNVKAFDHNESMMEELVEIDDIGSLEGSDFEYLE